LRAVRNVEFHWEGKFEYEVIPKAHRLDAGYRTTGKISGINERHPRKSDEELRNFLFDELIQRAAERPVQ
jgi:hypothetical protein